MLGVAHLMNTASGVAPLEQRPPRGASMRLPMAVLFLSVSWYVAVRIVSDLRTQERDQQAIALASTLFSARIGWSKKNLVSVAELIADDPRLKATLGTPEDSAALNDLLVDLKDRVTSSVIAVAGPDGK